MIVVLIPTEDRPRDSRSFNRDRRDYSKDDKDKRNDRDRRDSRDERERRDSKDRRDRDDKDKRDGSYRDDRYVYDSITPKITIFQWLTRGTNDRRETSR